MVDRIMDHKKACQNHIYITTFLMFSIQKHEKQPNVHSTEQSTNLFLRRTKTATTITEVIAKNV